MSLNSAIDIYLRVRPTKKAFPGLCTKVFEI